MVVPTDERILRYLKFRGAQRTVTLARHLGISETATRKQMTALQAKGLVENEDEAVTVGRPKRTWRLGEKAQARFPDSHALLTAEMIDSVRRLFGADGLDRLIADREARTLARYRAAMQSADTLAEKLAALADLRSEEGYMAESLCQDDGTWLLVENHCPICAAATACQGFCRSELAMLREVLGAEVRVERAEHIPEGARRCAYRIAAPEQVAR